MKTAVLFDLDGTLLDTLEDLTDATNYALTQFGCPARPAKYVRSIVGNGALRQMTLALPEGSAIDPEEILAVYKPYYQAHCDVKTRPYPGVCEALEALKEKFALGIVTNKPHPTAVELCKIHFPGIYTLGEEAGCPRKPDAAMVKKAMKALGADRCLYVGDSEVDARTAENAGVPCLTVLWGFRDREQLEAAGARYFCENPRDLRVMIEKILEG